MYHMYVGSKYNILNKSVLSKLFLYQRRGARSCHVQDLELEALEAKHLHLSNNISVKPLPQFFKLDIHTKISLQEILC